MRLDAIKAMTRAQKSAVFAGGDGVSAGLSLWIALTLSQTVAPFWVLLMAGVAGAVLSAAFGFSSVPLNEFETRGRPKLALWVAAMTGGLAALLLATGGNVLTVAAYVPVLVFVLGGGRLLARQVTRWVYQQSVARRRVLIYGAGQTGRQLVAALLTDDRLAPVAFIDDNPTLQATYVAGLRVHAPSALPRLMQTRTIDHVVLAMPSVPLARQDEITNHLRSLGCPVQSVPTFAEMLAPDVRAETGSANRFLNRPALDPVLPEAVAGFAGRRILVSGAGGSIGSELCRQIIASGPAQLVLLDHSELALFEVERVLRAMDPEMDLVPVLGSVCDADLVAHVLDTHRVEVILHAAAYKHVSLVQQNLITGVANNVLGTRVLADAARAAGVERFILISSDKAVRPTNAMGATKRLAELMVQTLAAKPGPTRFATVRFGNVLGSSGSVVPIFAEQIARGGPVTVTHPDVKRYFMTVEEATRLVLLAGATSQGGEVFVLDMGAPVPIQRLARQMIEAAGLRVRDEACPDGDIEISITGLRPGEKLQEELFLAGDLLPTPHPKILRAQEQGLSELEAARVLADLRAGIAARDDVAVQAVIDRWVEPHAHGTAQIAGE